MVLMSMVIVIGLMVFFIMDGFGLGCYFFVFNVILYFIVVVIVSWYLFYCFENGDDIVVIGVKVMVVFGLIVIVVCFYFGKKYVILGLFWVGSF